MRATMVLLAGQGVVVVSMLLGSMASHPAFSTSVPQVHWQDGGLFLGDPGALKGLSVVGDDAGGAFVLSLPGTPERKLSIRRLSPDGTQPWRKPLRFTRLIDDVKRPPVLRDGTGGLFTTWATSRLIETCGDLPRPRLKITRVDADRHRTLRNRVRWVTPKGDRERCNIGSQHSPAIVSDAQGGVIVAWKDSEKENVVALRMDGQEGLPLWDHQGVRLATEQAHVCGGNERRQPAVLAEDGASGVIAVWTVSDGSACEDLMAQRLDPNGFRLWGERGIEVTAPSSTAKSQSQHTVVSDDAGGIVVAWVDHQADIHAQRLGPLGERLWGDDGVLVAGDPSLQEENPLLAPLAGGVVVAWTAAVGPSEPRQILAQSLDPNGSPVWAQDSIVAPLLGDQAEPSVSANATGDLLVVWSDARGPDRDIYAQLLDASGQPLWSPEGFGVSVQEGIQDSPRVALVAAGDWVIVWADDRLAAPGAYAQRLSY